MLKFSVIIPVYNSAKTLAACLDALSKSARRDFETIVVDDGSSDGSASIAEGFPCRTIRLNENNGAASARNRGAAAAVGEVLVFVDADVVVRSDSLDVIADVLGRDPAATAVTGLLSADSPEKGFFTAYKNLYMNYVFRQCPREVDFLYGSVMAVRKSDFIGFDGHWKATDDTELGQRYKDLGKKIVFEPGLEVLHLKRYNFRTILRNDFWVPFWWAASFLAHKGFEDLAKQRRFAHARLSQQLSVITSFLLLIGAFASGLPGLSFGCLGLAALYLFLNRGLFLFMLKKRGVPFALAAAGFTWIDQMAMGLGAVSGFGRCLAGRYLCGKKTV